MHVTSMGPAYTMYIIIMCLFMHVLMDVCEIYHIIDLSFVIAYIYGIHTLYWTMCGGSKYITIHNRFLCVSSQCHWITCFEKIFVQFGPTSTFFA